jgi:hypothetical protein
MTEWGIGFSFLLLVGVVGGAAGVVRRRHLPEAAPGVILNEGISALTGGLLLILSAAIGVTVLRIADLLPEHYLVGFLMLGPLLLKLASTGYRFVRYYTDNPAYRTAGPPMALLRWTAPFLVAATVAVFATGIELWLFGYRFGHWWLLAHVISFLVWTPALVIHVLGHTRRSAEAARDEIRALSARAFTRRGLVVASLMLGAVLAVASLLYTSPFPPSASG